MLVENLKTGKIERIEPDEKGNIYIPEGEWQAIEILGVSRPLENRPPHNLLDGRKNDTEAA